MGVEAKGGTVGRTLDVLDRVAAHGRPVRFSELLAASPYPKATLYRFLQVLTAEQMLSFDAERGTYAPGLRLVRLAHAAWRMSSLAPLARPHLDRLSREIGETLHLAQLDHGQVLYVDKRNAAHPVEMFAEAGKVGPAYCTGVGKAMLAFLPESELAAVLRQQSFYRYTPRTLPDAAALCAELAEIRRTGTAFDREEHEPGITCIAKPILGSGGRPLGALSVSCPTARRGLDDLVAYEPGLARTAARIAADAQAWRFPDAGGGTPTSKAG